jgi:hypothetical protein
MSRRMKWAGHVTRVGEKRGAYRVYGEIVKEIARLEDEDVAGRVILKSICNNSV